MPTTKEDLQNLTLLGTHEMPTGTIEVFPNHAGNKMKIVLHCSEFTSLCPLTKQPDFAEIDIEYLPDRWVAETKSVKLFLEKYREVGIFYEHLAVDIGEKFIEFVQPIEVTITTLFNSRGGIAVTAIYNHQSNNVIS